MRRATWHAIVVAVVVGGCEAAPSIEPVEPVDPVEPVEVTGPGEEIARLQARVSELERQFEACETANPRAASNDGETEALPEGVEAPEPAPVPTKRTVHRDRSLLDELDEALPRNRRDETIELPNPARLLLGDE